MERLVVDRIYGFLKAYGLQDQRQHRFVAGRSAESQLLYTM